MTLTRESVFEEQVLINVGKIDNTIRPFEQICTFKETSHFTLFNKDNCKVSISIRTVATEMSPVNCVFDTGAGSDLTRENFLKQGLHKLIKPVHAADFKSATSNSFCVLGYNHFICNDGRLQCAR